MKGNEESCKLAFVSTDTPLQNILRKIKRSIKVRQNGKTLISVFAYFWALVPKKFISEAESLK